MFGLPPWDMGLGCPAILHASLARARAVKESEGFRIICLFTARPPALGWRSAFRCPVLQTCDLQCRAVRCLVRSHLAQKWQD